MCFLRFAAIILCGLSFLWQSTCCAENTPSSFLDPEFVQLLNTSASYTIAVLPAENLSVDPEISYHFRQRLTGRLEAMGYKTIKNELINTELKKLGVNHAGQLGLLPYAELKDISSADAYLSGLVEQSATQNAGVYNAYVYMCSLKLQDRSGKLLWSSLQQRIAKRRFAIDPVNILLDVFLVEAGGGDVKEAVSALADKMLATMPDGPIQIVVGDSLLDMAVEVQTQQ